MQPVLPKQASQNGGFGTGNGRKIGAGYRDPPVNPGKKLHVTLPNMAGHNSDVHQLERPLEEGMAGIGHRDLALANHRA
jgi:hypothetical protein